MAAELINATATILIRTFIINISFFSFQQEKYPHLTRHAMRVLEPIFRSGLRRAAADPGAQPGQTREERQHGDRLGNRFSGYRSAEVVGLATVSDCP
jgi:hypothetical protein